MKKSVPTPKELNSSRAATAAQTKEAPEKIDPCLELADAGNMERLLEGELVSGLKFDKTPLFQSALNAFRGKASLAA